MAMVLDGGTIRYAGETYDARREQPGWDTPTFANASSWALAVESNQSCPVGVGLSY